MYDLTTFMHASQVKPLTEEEKQEKLAELRAKMAAKRTIKAEEDAKEAKAGEQIRRKQGKVRSIEKSPRRAFSLSR